VADVLPVAAFELRDPIAMLILVIPDDATSARGTRGPHTPERWLRTAGRGRLTTAAALQSIEHGQEDPRAKC
jgi:hypothetical protein